MPRVIRCTLILICAFVATGCTNWRTLETPEPREAVAQISVNDEVKIVAADGSTYEFRVAAIKDDAVIGNNNERVLIEDIKIVEVRRFAAGKTGLLVLGPPVLIVGAIVIWFACCFTF
jgi:hypothetical protein